MISNIFYCYVQFGRREWTIEKLKYQIMITNDMILRTTRVVSSRFSLVLLNCLWDTDFTSVCSHCFSWILVLLNTSFSMVSTNYYLSNGTWLPIIFDKFELWQYFIFYFGVSDSRLHPLLTWDVVDCVLVLRLLSCQLVFTLVHSLVFIPLCHHY